MVGIAWGSYIVYPVYTCYSIPAKVSNRVYSVNLHYLERYQVSERLELNPHEIRDWKRSLESLPLVKEATYSGSDDKHGTWRVTFEHYKNCFYRGDFLELSHEQVADGATRVTCRVQFKNASMIPSQCRQ